MAYKILKPEQGRRVKAVLFDMDGLVLNSEVLYSRFWLEALEELGYHMTKEQVLGMRSLNGEKGQAYLEKCFGPQINYYTAREIRIRRMDAWVNEHGIEPKKGIYELMEYLKEHNIPAAITSSSPLDRIEAHLKPLGLYDKFSAHCSGYEVKHGKPDPDIYIYGAQKLGIAPEDCLALEDSPAGIESAKRAGCMAVVIPDQDEPGEETLENCFAEAESLIDVCNIIDELRV